MKLTPEIKVTAIGIILMFAVMPFEMQILQYVNTHVDSRPLYEFITDFGLGKWYVWPSALLSILGFALWKTKNLPEKFLPIWRGIIQFFLSVAAAGIVTNILKRLFARARPPQYLEHHISGFFKWHEMLSKDANQFHSFPSGHSTTVFAVATALALLLPEKRREFCIPIYAIACVLAYSRVIVEAHYPSDIMAGMLIGCWGAMLVARYLAKAKWFATIAKPAA